MDNFQKLCGQEHVKRAFEIAVAGNFSITVLDKTNSFTIIQNAFEAIGGQSEKLTLIPLCFCGEPNSAFCECDGTELLKFKNSLLYLEAKRNTILIETAWINGPKLLTELQHRETLESSNTIKNRIDSMLSNEIIDIERKRQQYSELLTMAVNRFSFGQQMVENTLEIAKVIARVDQETELAPNHISEAMMYKRLNSFEE